jgi:LuxR family transcriptional regulator, maltose regulon positive regulatory protein
MAIPIPLLETKLYIPKPRRGLVTRPRLTERLNRGGESKLTLVSAPAGFGKTTLLAEWLAATPAEKQTAWLSLDPSDNRAASSRLFALVGADVDRPLAHRGIHGGPWSWRRPAHCHAATT